MKFYLLIIIAASFFAFSCKKKEGLTISEAPSIELISINKTEVTEFVDSLVFTISYRDGDGNLGTESPDSTVIELRDNRDAENLVFGYHLSPRSPNGSSLIVQGQLQIVLKNIIILNSANNSETTSFSIRIKDRAQNWSNTVESVDINILR
jgi:hypothetical protein